MPSLPWIMSLVTRDVLCQWFSLMTSSLLQIVDKSPQAWPKSLFTVTRALFYMSITGFGMETLICSVNTTFWNITNVGSILQKVYELKIESMSAISTCQTKFHCREMCKFWLDWIIVCQLKQHEFCKFGSWLNNLLRNGALKTKWWCDMWHRYLSRYQYFPMTVLSSNAEIGHWVQCFWSPLLAI